MLPPHPAALAALSSAAPHPDLVPPPFEMRVAPVVDPACNLQVRCAAFVPSSPTRPTHFFRQTAALLKQLQLDHTFDFSAEKQQKYLARVFGHTAPAAPAAAALPLPHGSSRVAAFLACSQAEPPVQQQQQQQQQQPAAVAGAAATNPDEICLE
jgi:hypothetical protein